MQIRSVLPALAALATLAAAASPRAARAQGTVSSRCSSQIIVTVDACQKAVDLFDFMAPQLGTSITGGNAVLGSAGTLGGLGHFSLGIRANIIRGQVPQTQNVQLSLTQAQRSDFNPSGHLLGLPTAEAAIGIFKGVGVGLTNVGGIDALVSAFYVPDIEQDAVSVKATGGRLKLGYGVRVGVLQETALVPGLSISYLRRDLPTADLRATLGAGDSVRVTGLSSQTSAWRIAASKRFMIIGLTAGAGQDRYTSSASAGAYIAPRQLAPGITASFNGTVADVSQRLTRTNVFGGASLNLAVLRIAAEVGRVSGGAVAAPYNTFGGHGAADPYTYGSVGLRLGF